MAKIVLSRIDSRLIHGQVITKWLKRVDANRIIIIDDNLAEDKFMLDVYTMAAPPNVKVQILTIDTFIKDWGTNKYGEDKILLLFKDVDHVYNLFNEGFDIKELQVGGLGSGPDRVSVYKNISFNAKDVEQLEELSKKGLTIYLQPVPEDKSRTFEESIRKLKPKIMKDRKGYLI